MIAAPVRCALGGDLAANAMRGRSSVDEKRELLLQRVTADSEIVGSTV